MNGERIMSPGERAAYANGWQARDEEVKQLRAEVKRLQGEIDVLLSKPKEAT